MTPAQQQQHDYLLTQLYLRVRSNGQGGLTSADDLREFEKLIIEQLFVDPGAAFDSGPADPVPAQGNAGDYWLNETTGWLWRKPALGPWAKRTLLRGADSQVAGPKGEAGAQGDPGPAGPSAYQLAQQQGYKGTLSQWLATLKGEQGPSAYQVAVAAGYQGTAPQWLASLKGADSQVAGPRGEAGPQGKTGADGKAGPTGPSVYDVAVQQGYSGTAAQFLAGLKGADGQTPPRLLPPVAAAPGASDGQVGDQVINVTTGDYYEKAASGWTLRGNIKGPAGAKGDTGPAGKDGKDGKDGTSTTTTPSTGSGTGGHTIYVNGTQFAAQAGLDFIGDNISGENDAVNAKTKVKYVLKTYYDTINYYNFTSLPSSYFDACTLSQVRKTGGIAQVTVTVNSVPTTLIFSGDICDLTANPIAIPAAATVTWDIVYSSQAYYGTLRAKITLA